MRCRGCFSLLGPAGEKRPGEESVVGTKATRWTEVTAHGENGHWVETGWDWITGNSRSRQRLVPHGPRQRESQKDQSEAKGVSGRTTGCYSSMWGLTGNRPSEEGMVGLYS